VESFGHGLQLTIHKGATADVIMGLFSTDKHGCAMYEKANQATHKTAHVCAAWVKNWPFSANSHIHHLLHIKEHIKSYAIITDIHTGIHTRHAPLLLHRRRLRQSVQAVHLTEHRDSLARGEGDVLGRAVALTEAALDAPATHTMRGREPRSQVPCVNKLSEQQRGGQGSEGGATLVISHMDRRHRGHTFVCGSG
jgi:hypothetical protein